MAGPFYVDDGGDGTTENSWATADVSINALDTEYTFASGEIVYFGHDHICQATNAASLTITGPAADAPVLFISATQGSSPVAYAASTSNQIDTSEGAYDITFDGSFALYGLCVQSGRHILLANDNNEMVAAYNTTFKLGDSGRFSATTTQSKSLLVNCTVDCAADTTARATSVVSSESGCHLEITGITFSNVSNRTGAVFEASITGTNLLVSGADVTGFTNATACEILKNSQSANCVINNCITAGTWTPLTTDYPGLNGYSMLVNCGPADEPTYLVYRDYFGEVASTTAIYRTGGATVESTACAWLVTTRATYANESRPFKTPWIYATIASTGSKTFDVYTTNDTGDFTDAEVWLEVEYLGTADEAQTVLAHDTRTITDAAVAQTDDTTSTWNGSGPSFTYKQKLSVTGTVNETGMYRARVCVGLANIAGSRYFYVDPKVTVS